MSAQTVTGIDIGSFVIKAVVIENGGKQPKLISYGATQSPQPGFVSDNDVDLEAVSTAIRTLLTQLKAPTSNIIVSMPESKTYSRVLTNLPFMTDEELTSAIRYSSEEFVPLPADQVELYWQVLDRSKEQNKTTVFAIGVPKKLQEKYVKVLDLAKLKPKALETEMISATRLLVSSNVATTSLIISLGASSTDLSIVYNGVILLTRSIATGGLSLTKALAQNLNFQPLQAEEYKKVYGMLPEQLQGRIFQVLKPLVEMIAVETERIIQSYQTKNPKNAIQRVVLIGGGAKLPGLVVYLANRLGIETQQADPFGFLQKDPGLAAKTTADPQYAIGVGLALRQD